MDDEIRFVPNEELYKEELKQEIQEDEDESLPSGDNDDLTPNIDFDKQ